MPYKERKELYERIEDIRGRPLISYVTSIRHNASGRMSSDVIPEFTEQLKKIPNEQKEVDLLIVSNGGDPTVSWRLISLMREKYDKVGVLLPYVAYSAATLVALGADEIVMHPFSNLGPVDPQLKSDEGGQFSSEDLRHFIDFIKNEVGISDQEQMEKAFEFICKDVGARNIGTAQRSSQLSISMGRKLLELHMEDQNEVNAIAESLNKSFYHHGYPVGRQEARDIGLPIEDPSEELENKLWKIWNDFSKEMKCGKPFNPLEIVFEDEEAAQNLRQVPQVQIPQNLPDDVRQNAYQQILNQISVETIRPVNYELFQASLESKRMYSKFKTKGEISACRTPDMSISVNQIITSQGWERFIPTEQ